MQPWPSVGYHCERFRYCRYSGHTRACHPLLLACSSLEMRSASRSEKTNWSHLRHGVHAKGTGGGWSVCEGGATHKLRYRAAPTARAFHAVTRHHRHSRPSEDGVGVHAAHRGRRKTRLDKLCGQRRATPPRRPTDEGRLYLARRCYSAHAVLAKGKPAHKRRGVARRVRIALHVATLCISRAEARAYHDPACLSPADHSCRQREGDVTRLARTG